MNGITVKDIVTAAGGRLLAGDPDAAVKNISIAKVTVYALKPSLSCARLYSSTVHMHRLTISAPMLNTA